MLQPREGHTKELLDLADFLEDLDPKRFDMGKWGCYNEPRCICGWYMHNQGLMEKENWVMAADMMGLDHNKAHALFHACFMTPKHAAKVLRNLAVTGELVGLP